MILGRNNFLDRNNFLPHLQIRKFVLLSRLVFELLFHDDYKQFVLILTVMLIGTVETQVVDTISLVAGHQIPVLRIPLLFHFLVFQKSG